MLNLMIALNWTKIGASIIGLSSLVAALVGLWGKIGKPLYILICKIIETSQKLDDYFKTLDIIAYEFKPNGGNSLRDVINRLEKHTIISEKKMHSLINAHETAMYETLADGTVKWVSKRWLEITGLTLDEAIGYGWINSIHESDRSNVQQAWQKAIEEKRDFQISYRTQSNKFVNSKATPVITNKVPIGWIGIVEEINKAP